MLYLQPPPAAVASPRKLQAPKPASTYTRTSTGLTAPVHKTQETPPSPAGTMVGTLGGVSGGVLSEAPPTATSAPVITAKVPEQVPVKRMRIAAKVAEANLIHDVAPHYPPEAGRARIEGTVVLMAVIGKDGSVQDVQVESGLPMLAQAAMEAVKQWRYRPYLLNGELVEVDSRITINFTLSRG
jgi:protein TonB